MNVVSVMAHQDDELMCLGTMLKMKKNGCKLHFICLTGGEMGMVHKPDMPLEEAAAIRRCEMTAIANELEAGYLCLDYEDEFLYDTKETRLALIDALRCTQADVIFTHNIYDYNLDHMTTSALVRHCAMQMSFPMILTKSKPVEKAPAIFLTEPALGFDFEPTHWVDIDDVYEEKAKLALMHKSQDDAFKAAFGDDYGIVTWMSDVTRSRGVQCAAKHAEAFRPLMTRGFVKGHSVLP